MVVGQVVRVAVDAMRDRHTPARDVDRLDGADEGVDAPEELAHVARDERDLPGRNSEIADDGSARLSSQALELLFGDLPEPVALRNLVDV